MDKLKLQFAKTGRRASKREDTVIYSYVPIPDVTLLQPQTTSTTSVNKLTNEMHLNMELPNASE